MHEAKVHVESPSTFLRPDSRALGGLLADASLFFEINESERVVLES